MSRDLGTGPHRTLDAHRVEVSRPPSQHQEMLVFEASPVATIATWAAGSDLQLNAAARSLLGLGPRDRVRSLAELQTLLGVADDQCAIARALRGESVSALECRVQAPPGERTWSLDSRPIHEEGELVGAVATVRDVTDEVLEAEMADELLGRAAHDLRTPLTALKASAQLVARGLERLDAAARTLTFQLMLAQVEKLAGRIDEVVDAARIRRGRYDVTPVELDVSATLREIVQELESARTAPAIVLNAAPGVLAVADATRLRQIFVRLAAEALEHGTTLSITVAADRDAACITVQTDEQPIQRTTRQLARSILGRLGGRTEEPTPARLILAFPPPPTG